MYTNETTKGIIAGAIDDQDIKLAERVVRRLTRRYGITGPCVEELLSVGYLGLCYAASRYNGVGPANKAAYYSICVRGAVLDYLRRTLVRRCRGKSPRSRSPYRVTEQLSKSNGPDKTEGVHEDHSLDSLVPDQEREAIQSYRTSRLTKALLDQGFELHGHDDDGSPVMSYTDKYIPDFAISRQSARSSLYRQISLLSPRQQAVIQGLYFEEKTLGEIRPGNDRLSKATLSRLHTSAIRKLRDLFQSEGVSDITCLM